MPNLKCPKCNKIVEFIFYLIYTFPGKNKYWVYWCEECYDKFKKEQYPFYIEKVERIYN